MAFYATLRDYRFDFDNDDIRGARVFDRSERVDLGAIHDLIIDRDAWHIDYVVVDAADRLVLLPANRLHPSGDGFAAELDRDEFESLPDFDMRALDDPDLWDAMQAAYDDALAKLRHPCLPDLLEVPRGVGREPTLWDRFSAALQRNRSEILRREGEIERALRRPRPGRSIA